ncbi:DUF3168 domain-containing protein [Shinella yambaruensis]|uniref:DUF3168 domain-containing protein n=1 Tax=Shinella yambaruensis TaxID=415996 RepID=A0ABQ5ZWT9_9HYPH|nr:DUF3168 domain-containing protein [Shinella yambaruensis]MCJ8030014.1 DUF3168 domain-containing protein [Shinella yambaruensis]MCU7984306.1 DUF3168 domain-containing protein [Shinella yambaruensis]GLR55134.1 hypothetical protein GCM10007923_63550 [Shinella yambaruensis]
MTSPGLLLQAAFVAIIKDLGTAAGDRVFSEISENAHYPYVQVWGGIEVPLDEDCFDRTETTLQVDVWAAPETYLAAKEIPGQIRAAIHEKPLSIPGLVVDRVRVETIACSSTPPRYRGRLSIAVETQPA